MIHSTRHRRARTVRSQACTLRYRSQCEFARMHHAQGKGNVFTTDLALSVIMSAPRSVASWDIVMHRAGESIYLDVREGSAAFDTIVNETAQDAPEDEGKDGNMNRSAQEVKDALMNRSSLSNVNVLVAC